MNFEPLDSIHPLSIKCSSILQSSVGSQLNRLWEDTCTAATTLQIEISTPHHCPSASSTTCSCSDQHDYHCKTERSDYGSNFTDDEGLGEASDQVDSIRSKVQEVNNEQQCNSFNVSWVVPASSENTNRQLHGSSWVTVQNCKETSSTHPPTTTNHCFSRSSCTIGADQVVSTHVDISGSGSTDISGYVICTSKPDHLEQETTVNCLD